MSSAQPSQIKKRMRREYHPRSPQEAAAEALLIRSLITDGFSRRDPLLVQRIVSGVQKDIASLSDVASSLAESKIFLWEHDIWSLAINGSEEFNGTLLSETAADITEPEFWFFNGFGARHRVEEIPSDTRCIALFFLPQPIKGIGCIWFYANWYTAEVPDPSPVPWSSGFGLRVGESIDPSMSLVVACREFLKLKLAAKEPVRLPRGERRRMERAKQEVPQIRIIQLRQRESSGWHDATGRNYMHSWIVRGHWRKLHEPRKKDGAQVTWVDSYVKGHGPLLQPHESVFSVSR